MSDLTWWQKAVFYQIYPRSFADGNGDGIGDFIGMTARLDHLVRLGVDAIWLSPHYPSPFLDCGYDIADFSGVGPEYGSLDDFKAFLAAAHDRGLRVVLDLVLNHSSDQHPWFAESRASRDNPKRDWYIWRDGKEGGPPNNWVSIFGGSAWQLDEATGQYYYHCFLKEQPDLNWRHPELKQAMFDAVRFWLDLGVDGFRLDAVSTIFETEDLRDHTATISEKELFDGWRGLRPDLDPAEIDRQMRMMLSNQFDLPEVHEVLQELRQLIDSYPDRVLIGEADAISYYGDGTNELHLVFNFPLMRTNRITAAHVRDNQAERLGALPPGAWPCNTLGNHDSPRMLTRYGDGEHDAALARMHTALLLALKGTPFFYYGEEIGMQDLILTDIAQFRDGMATNVYAMAIAMGMPADEALAAAAQMTRDRARTPMQWEGTAHAGFCPDDVEPWLPVNPNAAAGVNVAAQSEDPASMLSFYRRLLAVRRATPALLAGDYDDQHEEAQEYFAFLRSYRDQVILVVCNMSPEPRTIGFYYDQPHVRTLLSTHERAAQIEDLARLELAPFEAYLGELTM
ncbi:MAG TPA: alpha-glucosidase [Roseiflexaceae bacterium]|nr:alpha-glucosidase [Roseiflexaceae bacterium]